MSFVSGPLIPPARRETQWDGLAHSSDWYLTIAEGIAGVTVPATIGPRPLDVLHRVVNNYTSNPNNKQAYTPFPAVIRAGVYKRFLGKGNPGDSTIRMRPPPVAVHVPFNTGWVLS
eukprot:gene15626-30516_t